jgi:hypothetical protein
VGKTEGNRLLGRPKSRCEDNFKLGLEEIVWGEGLNWIDLTYNKDKAMGCC